MRYDETCDLTCLNATLPSSLWLTLFAAREGSLELRLALLHHRAFIVKQKKNTTYLTQSVIVTVKTLVPGNKYRILKTRCILFPVGCKTRRNVSTLQQVTESLKGIKLNKNKYPMFKFYFHNDLSFLHKLFESIE